MADIIENNAKNSDTGGTGSAGNNAAGSTGGTESKQSGQKSFAERYSKKPSFTSESLSNKKDGGFAANTQQNDIAKKAEAPVSKSSTVNKVEPHKKAQAEYIYLVKGIDAGRNAWYYVLVERLKVQLFLKALNDDIIHLENYGKILYSAYGDEPPAEITKKLKEEYGIED